MAEHVLDPAAELSEIVGWLEETEDPRLIKSALVNRLRHVGERTAAQAAVRPVEDQLLVVIFKTDQANVQRRLATILAAAEPTDPSVDYTQAVVAAFPIDEVAQDDLRALETLVTADAVAQLRITPMVEPELLDGDVAT